MVVRVEHRHDIEIVVDEVTRQVEHHTNHPEKNAPERPPARAVRKRFVFGRTPFPNELEHIGKDREVDTPRDAVREVDRSACVQHGRQAREKSRQEQRPTSGAEQRWDREDNRPDSNADAPPQVRIGC
jgi:hypothetical protein